MPLAQYYKLAYTMSVGKGEMCFCGFVKSVLTQSFWSSYQLEYDKYPGISVSF